MYAVIFEVFPNESSKEEYLNIASNLRSFLENRPGFLSIERFQSLTDEGKILSLSFWENEDSIEDWRNLIEHRNAQKQGKNELFKSYRIRVAEVKRDYSESNRLETPQDSNEAHT